MRTVYENGVIMVHLVAAKSKVSPIKQQTIPRLELLGSNILARLTSSVGNTLAAKLGQLRTFHWTDSSALLCSDEYPPTCHERISTNVPRKYEI